MSEYFASARAGGGPGPWGGPGPEGGPGPVIGLTTYRQQARSGAWDVPASFLPGVYLEGVTLAGGIAVLLPPQPVDAGIAARVVGTLDHDIDHRRATEEGR